MMMAGAEEGTRRRGLRRIGLGVALDNPQAKVFNERPGFKDAEFGVYLTRWQYADAQDERHQHDETAVRDDLPLPSDRCTPP